MAAQTTTLEEIAGRYDGILFDAYGVLVTHGGPVPGAAAALRALRERGIPALVVSNDASRPPEQAARWYRSLGLPINDDDVITSGSLLTTFVEQEGLRNHRAVVLGPEGSRQNAERAGLLVVESPQAHELLLVCDEAGFEFPQEVDAALNGFLEGYAEGRPPRWILVNPDVVYPQGAGRFGVAAGGLAVMMERALRAVLDDLPAPLFTPLGKPHAPIFEAAARQIGSKNLLMVGDQLATDVAGAAAFGIDSALVADGFSGAETDGGLEPTWVLEDWGRSASAPAR